MREDRIGFVTGAVAALALVGWMAGGVAAHDDAKPEEAKAACCAKADAKCGGEGAECCAGHAEGGAKACCKGEDGKACHQESAACCGKEAKAEGGGCCRRHHGTEGAGAGCGACCRGEVKKEARR